MRNYETIFILKPTLEEEVRKELINKFTSIISANGEVVKIEEWGNRKLAYEIEKFRDGYYVLVNFNAAPSLPMELERNYRIADDVIRYMIVNLDDK
ncbi:30S ribosomal protein S6 [Acidaminobacter sp.]|jgi:small subunit ribosomal protein S6|uniref:30S ribosomal protein S6 n=1 Tax=Acidaminobacter sp. TaxID=1872102 RepID=UPI001382FF15|nr:30S ribosomal protein S6 [Acidaminobacter sp.]MDK9710219.1 30S ribosomal protein S6 [Acidaminobacter sp.]MZQ98695.1 30S ribosomal protein S6 [Acidaminobacter sp.]